MGGSYPRPNTLGARIRKAGIEGKKQARRHALQIVMPRNDVTLLVSKRPHMHFAKWLRLIDEVLSESSRQYPSVTSWSGKVE